MMCPDTVPLPKLPAAPPVGHQSYCAAQAMSVLFGGTTQNSFPLGVSQHGPRLLTGLPDVHPPRAEREEAIDLGTRSSAAVVRSRWTRFLTPFRSAAGMKHMPTGADECGPMTTSRSRPDSTCQRSARAQNRARAGSAYRRDTRRRRGAALHTKSAILRGALVEEAGPPDRMFMRPCA